MHLPEEGGSVLADLLLKPTDVAPLLPDVNRRDLIATAVWYVWWERRQFTHGEQILEAARSAQAILTLAKNFSRATNVSKIQRHG